MIRSSLCSIPMFDFFFSSFFFFMIHLKKKKKYCFKITSYLGGSLHSRSITHTITLLSIRSLTRSLHSLYDHSTLIRSLHSLNVESKKDMLIMRIKPAHDHLNEQRFVTFFFVNIYMGKKEKWMYKRIKLGVLEKNWKFIED
jgi:hypothetical protein